MDNLVKGTLEGCDGNAFELLGYFSKLAKEQGFKKDWVDDVITEAKSGDYEYLIQILSENMTV